MIDNINVGKLQWIQCKKCNTMLDNTDDLQTCKNCGYVVKEMQFEVGNTFTDCKLDGQVYDLDECQRDKSYQADIHIKDMVRDLKLNSEYPEYLDRIGATPLRIIKFAYKGMFLDHGTNIRHYSAAALYIALRFYKAPFLLMDFSDKLAVNLYKLAKSYRKLAKFLNVTLKLNEKLPAIDPSLYIPRFCKELDFGNNTEDVKLTAIKLLKRMKLDWITHGRRPSSLCGAAILISGRMHGFNITTSEVCQIVLVCEETLRKRLEEFRETEVATLTRERFDEIDIEKMQIERDPPAFLKKNNNNNQTQAIKQQQEQQMIKNNQENNLSDSQQIKQNNNNSQHKENIQVNDNLDEENSNSQELDESQQQQHLKITQEKMKSEQQDFDRMVDDIQTSLKEEGQKDGKQKEFMDNQIQNLELAVQISKNQEQLGNSNGMDANFNSLATINKSKKILILEDKGNMNEDEELSELSDQEQFILTKEEQTVKSIIWYKMNEQWLEDQQKRIPKLAIDSKKDPKKRNKRRNDQLLNEDDPVFALMKSKNKKVKNNLDEKSLRELLHKSVMDVKLTQFGQVFENAPVGNIEFKEKPAIIGRKDLLDMQVKKEYNNISDEKTKQEFINERNNKSQSIYNRSSLNKSSLRFTDPFDNEYDELD